MVDFDAPLRAAMKAFGQPAVYTPKGGQPFAVTGVFDREYLEVKFNEMGAALSSRRPVLGLRAAAIPAGVCLAQGDSVEVGGATWKVVTVEPDSHGHVFLGLQGTGGLR